MYPIYFRENSDSQSFVAICVTLLVCYNDPTHILYYLTKGRQDKAVHNSRLIDPPMSFARQGKFRTFLYNINVSLECFNVQHFFSAFSVCLFLFQIHSNHPHKQFIHLLLCQQFFHPFSFHILKPHFHVPFLAP